MATSLDPHPAPARPVVDDSDGSGVGPAVHGLAEFAAHGSSAAPMTLALLGAAGSGKSFALGRLLETVSALSARAASVPGSPFTPRIVVARVEADSDRDPAAVLANGVYAALNDSGYAALAQEAATAGADRQAAARAASERLIDLRRRLDTERQTLHDLTGRKARLSETTLYRSGGSRIDAWARANRSKIESRLRAFGFAAGEPLATYKDLVRDVADNRGFGGRASAFLHAMWAFRGQTRLLVFAVFFLLLAWGLGVAIETQPTWLAWMRGSGEATNSAADWLAANIGLFGLARVVSIWIAVGCLALNVFRAARFTSMIYRGVGLLYSDVQESQRDLDSLISNQTRHVDALASECETQAHRAEEAERRAIAQGARPADTNVSPFAFENETPASRQARGFFAALSLASVETGAGAPQRIVVGVDELDSLAPQAAARFVDTTAALLARAPFVTVLAADGRRLAEGWGGDGAEALARRVQAAVRVDAASNGDHARLVRRLVGAEAEADKPVVDASASTLDHPISAQEAHLLEALAPLAGRTPRKVKQFVSAYRLARARTQAFGPLALALALDIGGTDEERAAVRDSLSRSMPGHNAVAPAGQPRLADAYEAMVAAQGAPVSAAELRTAQTLAASHSLTP